MLGIIRLILVCSFLHLQVLTWSLNSQRKTGPLFSKYGQNDLVNIYKLHYHDSQFLSIALI